METIHDTLTWVVKMERILLVEPNYKNKYPPIGLMKISTYFKQRGDFVEFQKGLLPQIEASTFDKVFITTLFTFDFMMCIQTIRYYIAIVGIEKVYVGGIAATIMPQKFSKEIPELNLITGQLISSNTLGYNDNVNIDVLELDYDMLWDISYNYPAADSYFIYTSRGCPRKCSFCAVKTLEPSFYDCDNIEAQIKKVDACFGIKKQLLIMDNNILYSKKLDKTVNIIKNLGFATNNNKIKKKNNMKYYVFSLSERIKNEKKYDNLLTRIEQEFNNLKFVRISKKDTLILKDIIKKANNNSKKEVVEYILENQEFLIDFFERYNYHMVTRYVDFNQGLDARLFTDEKTKKLAELAINPCRIAFDSLKTQDDYFKALESAYKNGIKKFSNYLLYNFDEKPEDLWKRLYLNIQFCKKYGDVSLFSFPMKYASIQHTDRNYIGKHWNKKYLRALNIILNVTSGVVAKEEDFFLRAFGNNENEFIEILTMPDAFVRYRDFFEQAGLTRLWKDAYKKLSDQEKINLIAILEKIPDNPEILRGYYGETIDEILFYYSINKKHVTEDALYFFNFVNATKRKQLENMANSPSATKKQAI